MDCAEGAQEIPPGSEKLHDDKSLRELHEQEIPRSHEIEKFTFLPPLQVTKYQGTDFIWFPLRLQYLMLERPIRFLFFSKPQKENREKTGNLQSQ